jgi:biotin-(acetyl-CoA carboxylase) ligase
MIAQLSSVAGEKLAPLSCEKLLAVTFTQLEGLLNTVQTGQVQQVLDLYYSYWLHRSAEITYTELVPVNWVTEAHVSFSDFKDTV